MIIDWLNDHISLSTMLPVSGFIATDAFTVPDLGGDRLYTNQGDGFKRKLRPYTNKADRIKRKIY